MNCLPQSSCLAAGQRQPMRGTFYTLLCGRDKWKIEGDKGEVRTTTRQMGTKREEDTRFKGGGVGGERRKEDEV